MGENDENAAQDVGETEQLDAVSRPARCASCGAFPAWESLTDNWGERWLAVCGCGRVEAFFPDRRHPDEPSVDPLTLFLQGHLRPRLPATPAWQRLFLRSIELPSSVCWRRSPHSCPDCELVVTFGFQAWPRPGIHAVCTLCLNCGYVSAEYRPWQGQNTFLCGNVWAPACPAVQRLRDCTYRPWRGAGPASNDFESSDGPVS